MLRTDSSIAVAVPMPVCRDKKSRWVDAVAVSVFVQTARSQVPDDCVFVVERVASRPADGVSSVFKFGAMFGGIMSAFSMFCKPIVLCTPVQWKRALGLLKQDKSASLALARQLYPSAYLPTAEYEGQAEAILLARWYLEFKLKEAKL